jgi:serine/threonine protein kinase
MSFQLVVEVGQDTGHVFTVFSGDETIMGRGSHAHYRLNDPRVSRNHCRIYIENEHPHIECLGGSGGTKVNSKPVTTKTRLKPGDLVEVGDTKLRMTIADMPLAAVKNIVSASGKKGSQQAKTGELEELAGETLGAYDIGPVIGRGTSSVVFCANDNRTNQPVALKVLLPEFAKVEEEVQRFIRAIKTMLPLEHPNLIKLYGAGKTGVHCWVAMEYVAGENLEEVIARIGVAGMLDWRNAYRVALQVGRALEYAHAEGIVHRNVTPKNILRDAASKDVKLGDLMLAKAMEGVLAQQITRPGELLGAVEYMSPERTRGTTDLDHRSDLYGLGATLYALLTGRPPFTGATLVEKITLIRQNEPAKPTKYQLSIPHAFEMLVLKLLAKQPEDRYQSASAMLKDLEKIGKTHNL